jgi:Flp pilus assembly protein TadG
VTLVLEFWRNFSRDQCGASLPLVGLGMLAIISSAALGIDYTRAVTVRKLLTNAADAAALAAASRLPDAAAARAAAIKYVEKNVAPSEYGTVVDAGDVQIGTWDSAKRTFTANTDANAGGSAVRVTAHLSEARGNKLTMFFGSVLGTDSLELSGRAIAGRGGPPCALILNPADWSAMYVSGSSFTAVACGIQINSKATGALKVDGASTLKASDICVSGTSDLKSGDISPTPKEYCVGKTDPLADLAPPSIGACDYNGVTIMNQTATLEPGVYCGGLTLTNGSDITLNDGVYVIKDGPFLANNVRVSGIGVTFFLTGTKGLLNFKGTSELDLTAPTTGNFKGILFFQDRAYGGWHKWGGKAATNLRGVIYFPSALLWSKNDNIITPENSCTVVIVDKLEMYSGSGMSIDLSSNDCRNALAGPYGRGIVLLD